MSESSASRGQNSRVAYQAMSSTSPFRAGFPAKSVCRLVCVALTGVFVANCGNQTVQRRSTSKEIGAFSHPKYGAASPRVVADGTEVPKGGGRLHVGRPYTIAGKRYAPYTKPTGYTIVGSASWYGEAFHGRKTANGEVYDRHSITAAHPTMPLPSYARVTNTLNGRSIVVRVNDRGPYHGGRVLDVSQRTADALAFRHLGTARVRVEYLGNASLGGSDDGKLLASLRTDGNPAALPGQSASTMMASADGGVSRGPAAGRDLNGDGIDDRVQAPVVGSPAPARFQPAAATPRVQPAAPALAYTEQPRSAPEPVAAAAPVATAMMTAPQPGLVRAAPRPPNRPFDLDTIPGANMPLAQAASPLRGTVAPQRQAVAQLFYAQPQGPAARFSNTHPLARDLTAQAFRPLTRD